MNRISKSLALAVVSLSVLAAGAHANSVNNSDNGVPTAEGSNFRWHFTDDASGPLEINTGNMFTIYDFNGYVPGSELMPAGWDFSAQPVGITPSGVLITDDPAAMNLTWTRTGGPVQTGPNDIFSALSNSDTHTVADYAAVSTITSIGGRAAAAGKVWVPSKVTTAPVPEPGSLALLSTICLPGLALFRRKK